jgi:hypothetical protein
MSIELVYLMRTCAAALLDGREVPKYEIADILTEASNMLDVPAELGEPMEVIDRIARPGVATWGDQLGTTPRPCPACGKVSARTVRRDGRKLMLICPCSATWEYGT